MRGYDIDRLHNDLMLFERGVNPVWEDSVTMAVNAAKPLLSRIDPQTIGLLIVATETGLDYEKSLSTWVHRFLGLPSTCRHFEVKSACYGGTLALKQSLAWLRSGMLPPEKKALIITTDHSLISLHEPWEYVNGAGAVAFVVSDQPDFFIIEPENYGFYTSESSDVIRPLPWVETGNADDSLYSYMDGLVESYEAFCKRLKDQDMEKFLDYMIYHVPFAGISYRAHKRVMTLQNIPKSRVMEAFELKTKPSLYFPQRIGGTYTGSIFIALLSLVYYASKLKPEDRVGIFSYGAGYSAEFYSGLIGPSAHAIAKRADLETLLNKRQKISVEDYENAENERVRMSREACFSPDFNRMPQVYDQVYNGKKFLTYRGSNNYMRTYEWS